MMASRRPRMGAMPGVMGMLWRPAHSIVSLLPVTGTHTGGRLHRPGPDGDVAIRPESALVGEDLFGPRPANDLPGLLEARARIGQRDLVDVVLARDAAGESRNEPPVRHTVEHRQLLGEPPRGGGRGSRRPAG